MNHTVADGTTLCMNDSLRLMNRKAMSGSVRPKVGGEETEIRQATAVQLAVLDGELRRHDYNGTKAEFTSC